LSKGFMNKFERALVEYNKFLIIIQIMAFIESITRPSGP